jgi:hypothetical protein
MPVAVPMLERTKTVRSFRVGLDRVRTEMRDKVLVIIIVPVLRNQPPRQLVRNSLMLLQQHHPRERKEAS